MEAVFLLVVGSTSSQLLAITALTMAVGFSGFAISGKNTTAAICFCLPVSFWSILLMSPAAAALDQQPVVLLWDWCWHTMLHAVDQSLPNEGSSVVPSVMELFPQSAFVSLVLTHDFSPILSLYSHADEPDSWNDA